METSIFRMIKMILTHWILLSDKRLLSTIYRYTNEIDYTYKSIWNYVKFLKILSFETFPDTEFMSSLLYEELEKKYVSILERRCFR